MIKQKKNKNKQEQKQPVKKTFWQFLGNIIHNKIFLTILILLSVPLWVLAIYVERTVQASNTVLDKRQVIVESYEILANTLNDGEKLEEINSANTSFESSIYDLEFYISENKLTVLTQNQHEYLGEYIVAAYDIHKGIDSINTGLSNTDIKIIMDEFNNNVDRLNSIEEKLSNIDFLNESIILEK